MKIINLDIRTSIRYLIEPFMSEKIAVGFRAMIPAASEVCRTQLASLREQWHAAYVRQRYVIRQSGAWPRVPVLWAQAGLAYCSLQLLRCLFPLNIPDSWRSYHLERVLAFCTQ